MHGERDFTVPYKQSERLYAALKRAGADTQLKLLPRAGHSDKHWLSEKALSEVERFLAQWAHGG